MTDLHKITFDGHIQTLMGKNELQHVIACADGHA